MKRLALTILLTAAAAVAAEPAKTAPAAPQPAQPKIAASINGDLITVDQLNRLYNQLSPEMIANYEKSGGKKQFLDFLIRKRLVLQEAAKENFDQRPEIQESLQVARDSVLFDRYIRDVVSTRVVTEADLQAYYVLHEKEFARPITMKLRHIIVTPSEGPVVNTTGDDAKTKEEALQKIQSIASAIRTGANFADMAAKFSEDSTSYEGGDLGWVPLGKMVPEFEQAALRLTRGEMSDVVESPFGYHLILLEDRREAGTAPYAEVRETVRERLLREKASDILSEVNKLSTELRSASKVTVYRENL